MWAVRELPLPANHGYRQRVSGGVPPWKSDRHERCRDTWPDGGRGPNYSTTAMQSTSTSMPSRAAAMVVRAGGSCSKYSLYTSLNSPNRVRSVTYALTFTTLSSPEPEASRIVLTLSKVWRTWSVKPSGIVPVSGFTGPCPEMNTKSPATTACEYGPAGAGPFSAITVFLIDSPFLPDRLLPAYVYLYLRRQCMLLPIIVPSPVPRRAPDSTALVPLTRTCEIPVPYLTFPRAATRVSSTTPPSPTRYTSSCRFTVLQMWLGIICKVSPTSRSQSSSTESIPCSSVSLSSTASGYPTTWPYPSRLSGSAPGPTSVANVLLPPSMMIRSGVGLLTTVHTTTAAHSSSEQAPSRACILS